MESQDLKTLLHDLIEEAFTPKPIDISPRWAGGTIVLKPGNDSQAKEIPIEVFWKKITGLRDSLRVLEQKLNTSAGLSNEEKATFQSYITKAYGSLTTFNILFKEDKHKFVGTGSGSDKAEASPKMSYAEAKKKLGMNEYE